MCWCLFISCVFVLFRDILCDCVCFISLCVHEVMFQFFVIPLRECVSTSKPSCACLTHHLRDFVVAIAQTNYIIKQLNNLLLDVGDPVVIRNQHMVPLCLDVYITLAHLEVGTWSYTSLWDPTLLPAYRVTVVVQSMLSFLFA